MKRLRFIIIILGIAYIFSSLLLSINFKIEKVNEFHYTSDRTYSVGKNVSILYPYLYTLTDYGLEIYLISNEGNLDLLTRKQITDGMTMEIIDDNIYVATRMDYYNPFNAMIYKIDVSDPNNPIFVQTLEFDEEVWFIYNIFDVNDHLLLNTPPTYPLLNHQLEIVQEFTIDENKVLRHQINEHLMLVQTGLFSYDIYDFSDFDNISVVGSGNISEVHDLYGALYYKTYQDTILIVSGQREMSFWDISDPDDWQLLHNKYIQDDNLINYGYVVHIFDSYLFYLNGFNLVVIDLDDYSHHQILEVEYYLHSFGIDADFWDGNIYITTPRRGIRRFGYTEGVFFKIETIGEYFKNTRVFQNGDYVFIGGSYNKDGTIVFDISDPLQIEEINRIEENTPHVLHLVDDDLLVLRKYNGFEMDSTVEIWDVYDPNNPTLRNIVDLSNWLIQHIVPIIDEYEPGVLYIMLWSQLKLLKYDISEPGEAELLFEFDLPSMFLESYNIRGGTMYLASRRGYTNWYDLRIYSGLLANEPYFQNIIYNAGKYHKAPNTSFVDSYLAFYLWSDGSPIEELDQSSIFYDITDPCNPEYVFDIVMNGRPFIMDDIIFQSPSSTVYVFDVNQNTKDSLDPLTHFINGAWTYYKFFQEVEGNKYLYCVSASHISVNKYSYELSVDDDEIVIPIGSHLSRSYPNPFNPETKISFYLEKEKKVKLEIFNIRGQKLVTLIDDLLPEGEHSLVWSPETYRGRDLPSGVYLYRLQAGDYDKTRKMLYLK